MLIPEVSFWNFFAKEEAYGWPETLVDNHVLKIMVKEDSWQISWDLAIVHHTTRFWVTSMAKIK